MGVVCCGRGVEETGESNVYICQPKDRTNIPKQVATFCLHCLHLLIRLRLRLRTNASADG